MQFKNFPLQLELGIFATLSDLTRKKNINYAHMSCCIAKSFDEKGKNQTKKIDFLFFFLLIGEDKKFGWLEKMMGKFHLHVCTHFLIRDVKVCLIAITH